MYTSTIFNVALLTTITTTTAAILPRTVAPSAPVCYTDPDNIMPEVDASNLANLLADQGKQCCLDDGSGHYNQGNPVGCATTNDNASNGGERVVTISGQAPGMQGICVPDSTLMNYVKGLIDACRTSRPDGEVVDGKLWVGGWQAVVEVPNLYVKI